jgi:hypothetical protein
MMYLNVQCVFMIIKIKIQYIIIRTIAGTNKQISNVRK